MLRALGARPVMTTADGLIGVSARSSSARCSPWSLRSRCSPLSPLGAVRSVYPDRGYRVRLDGARPRRRWRSSSCSARWRSGSRTGRRRIESHAGSTDTPRRSTARRAVAGLGLSAPAATGVRFALEPGRGRSAVPVRSAILGAALAIVVVVSTLTFAASLHTLVSRPALYGWNWDYELSGGRRRRQRPRAVGREGARPRPRRRGLVGGVLRRGQIDGLSVPAFGSEHERAVGPPLLSGHGLDGPSRWCSVRARSPAAQTHRRHRRGNTGGQHPVDAADRGHRDDARDRRQRIRQPAHWRWAPARCFRTRTSHRVARPRRQHSSPARTRFSCASAPV